MTGFLLANYFSPFAGNEAAIRIKLYLERTQASLDQDLALLAFLRFLFKNIASIFSRFCSRLLLVTQKIVSVFILTSKGLWVSLSLEIDSMAPQQRLACVPSQLELKDWPQLFLTRRNIPLIYNMKHRLLLFNFVSIPGLVWNGFP